MSSPQPTNKALYNRVKAEAKRKFAVYPSAYASGYIVREYKKRGGTYKGKRPSPKSGLQRWFDEKWIDVCYYPRKVSCGRPKGGFKGYATKYPYCRPSKRVSPQTPKTAQELTQAQRKSRCARKRKSPRKRVMPKSKRRSPRKQSRRRKSSRRKSSKRRSSRRKSRYRR